MKCPRCSGELKASSLRELSLIYNAHSCSNCQGLWLRPERLGDIEATIDQRFVEVRNVPSKEQQMVPLNCPACEGGVVMNKVPSRRDEKVVLDVCPKCKHVWLDPGEREAIEQQSLIALMQDFFKDR